MAFFVGKRTKDTLVWMLSTKALPAVGVLVPIYLIFRDVGLLDVTFGLMIVYTLVNLPIVVWMLFSFFKEVPREVLEAGRMDGAQPKDELYHLLLPLSLPGIASTSLLAIILSWNEAFWSLNLTAANAAPLSFDHGHRAHPGLRLDEPAPAGAWPHLRRREVARRNTVATIKLTNIRKSFGDVDIIKGVSLGIDDREFVVFVGPSGCGKSTLLRLIAGLEEISDGDLFIDGVRSNDVPPAKRGLAMVFQSYALYPHMSVADNMAFSLRLAHVSKEEREKKVQEAARVLQLEPLLHRKPKELSGGQRQRVAIGRAIVRNPKVFLFDEPLSNLDASLRVQMR